MSQALACYNVKAIDDEDDSHNINILKCQGSREVRDPEIEDLDIMEQLKIKQLNIKIKEESKYAMLGDYWDDAMVYKVTELLHEYQDLFPTKFTDLKGIINDLGVMKITLNLDMK